MNDSIPGSLEIRHQGARLWLLAQRAAYLPEAEALLVSDVHLGKAASFRELGVPVPAGTTGSNLQRLQELVERVGPKRLIVLGDLFHSPQGLTAPLIQALQCWLEQIADVEVELIEGNHDRNSGKRLNHLLTGLGLNLRLKFSQQPIFLEPFLLCHEPIEWRRYSSDEDAAFSRSMRSALQVTGHIHPVVQIKGLGRDALRLPCFWRNEQALVLPAFGEFTGGYPVDPKGGECFVVADRVIKV